MLSVIAGARFAPEFVADGSLPNLTAPFVETVESAAQLDAVGAAVGGVVRGTVPEGATKQVLSGAWLGHALHPLLTDLVIGSFTSATLLDLLGGDRSGGASERLIAVGVVAYLPTALTGASDYADHERSNPSVRRAGVVHAAANSLALGLYVASLRCRRRGRRTRGKLFAVLGATALGAAGHLGGHLSYARGVGVDGSLAGAPPT